MYNVLLTWYCNFISCTTSSTKYWSWSSSYFGGVGHYEGETAGSIGVVTAFTDLVFQQSGALASLVVMSLVVV
jgi:hypothetical protein